MNIFQKIIAFFKRRKNTKPCSTKSDQDFERAFNFVLKWEGNYSNDKHDPGGETKFGISKRAHPNEDIRNLTVDRAKGIYKRDYWQKSACDKLPWPLSWVHFDCAVNVGVRRANKILESIPGSTDIKTKAMSAIDKREKFYLNIIKARPKMKKFQRGWFNRTKDLREQALS